VLRACFDIDSDGIADRCMRWRPDGTPIAFDPIADAGLAEAAAAEVPEPVASHSTGPTGDDPRIESSGGAIQVCPYDRACLRFMPRLAEEQSISEVAADADYRRAAVSIVDGDAGRAVVELWDLERGRAYARVPFRGLMRDAVYAFSTRLGRGVLIAIAGSGIDDDIAVTLYGLDGSFRGMLAGGAKKLELTQAIETSGLYLLLEEQPDGRPYLLHAVDLATGAASVRQAIPRNAGAAMVELRRLSPGIIAAAQWGDQLRLDVIDLRTRAVRTLRAPSC
jgi:hypothetical protein